MTGRFAAIACAVALVGVGSAAAHAAPATLPGALHVAVQTSRVGAPRNVRVRTTVVTRGGLPAHVAASESALPLWSADPSVAGVQYSDLLVGHDPRHRGTPVTIDTPIIPVRFTFTDFGNHVFDASAPDPCNGTRVPTSATALVKASPVYVDRPWTFGPTNVGTTQYIDAFQRAQFWRFVRPGGVNPTYHLRVHATSAPVLDVTVSGGAVQTTACGARGFMDMGTFDAIVQSVIPQLASAGVTPRTFPIFLTSNVVFYEGSMTSCCIYGYHSLLLNPAFNQALQTYAVSVYDSAGGSDVAVLTHEVGEWANDPIPINPTPPWGHTGQVSGCQANLEVGDPLTGTNVAVPKRDGGAWHVQELAFFSWFYDQSPSWGVNGWYSNEGTFRAPATLCAG